MIALRKTWSWVKTGRFFLLIVLIWVSPILAEETVIIKSKNLQAMLDLPTMSLDVRHLPANVTWRMSRESSREFVYEKDGEIHQVSLADSRSKKVTRLGESAVLVSLADFRLDILIWIDNETEDLFFKLIPLEEDHQYKIKGIIYPRPFEVPISSDSYAFFTWHQGFMIPGNWHGKLNMNNPVQFNDEARIKLWGELMQRPANWWECQDRLEPTILHHTKLGCFGAVQPRSGFLAIIDDNCRMDTWMSVKHIPGQHTSYRIYWRPTMGKFGYPRIISYHFEKDANYVKLIKYYRKYFKKPGYIKTLAEKNRENPMVEKLKGAINLRARISRHDKRTFVHEVYNTFQQVGKQVEEFRKKVGADRASISLSGWQRYGHDQEYPDIMPPMSYAGGSRGLDSLATKVQKMGYIFGLATDNYYDITLDAASFDEEVTLKDSRGKYLRRSTWAAGVNSFICPRWAIRFLRRNFEVGRTDYPSVHGLLHIAHPDQYFLGNYVPNWECYDPRHPLTRNETRQAVEEILQYFRDKRILLSIEHYIDWAVPYLFSARTRAVHRGVYGQNRTGSALSIPIPLFQLVFHDCTYVTGDNYLYSLLWGAQASLSLPVPEEQGMIDDALLLAKLHRAVGWDEMVDHRFLTEDYQVQETTFSSGAKVWVDFNKLQFRITGVPGIEPEIRQARIQQRRR